MEAEQVMKNMENGCHATPQEEGKNPIIKRKRWAGERCQNVTKKATSALSLLSGGWGEPMNWLIPWLKSPHHCQQMQKHMSTEAGNLDVNWFRKIHFCLSKCSLDVPHFFFFLFFLVMRPWNCTGIPQMTANHRYPVSMHSFICKNNLIK